MGLTNCFLPMQPDRNERQPLMDPRAWLLKVVIVRIELQQKDPTFPIRSLPPGSVDLKLWHAIMGDLTRSYSGSSDRLDLACEVAALDAFALFTVIWRVEKNDNLREVLARALRSIREAILHAIASDGFVLIRYLQRRLQVLATSKPVSKEEYVDASESDSELAIALQAFLTSVLHLLTSVFQYLIGYVDRGGTKTYSSGAFDFRASFVSLVLFQGAYVWIKFRQAARPDCRKRRAPDVDHNVKDLETCNLKGVYGRPIKEKSSGTVTRFKYEPRFTPPRQEGDDGTDVCSKRLPLGEYHTRAEAQIVLQIARYHYDKDGGYVELEDGRYKFPIPPMSKQERGLAGEVKRKWVTCTAKQVGKQMYADFRREKGKQLAMAIEAGSHEAQFNEPSSAALSLPCPSFPMLTALATEPVIASAAPSAPDLQLLPDDGAIVGDVDDFSKALSGCEEMIAELFHGPGLPSPPDQQSSVVSYQMQYQGFAQLLGDPSLPEVGAVPVDIEHTSEPELNIDPCFQQGRDLQDAGTENTDGRLFLSQSVSDLQQLLLCQKKRLGDNARQFVDLDHQLKAYQIQISRLQQENESLKSRLEQVAKSQVATWTGIMMDIQKRIE